jgi:hypothetical protein
MLPFSYVLSVFFARVYFFISAVAHVKYGGVGTLLVKKVSTKASNNYCPLRRQSFSCVVDFFIVNHGYFIPGKHYAGFT